MRTELTLDMRATEVTFSFRRPRNGKMIGFRRPELLDGGRRNNGLLDLGQAYPDPGPGITETI